MASKGNRKGNSNCCVVECSNTYGNTTSSISFYKFPPNNNVGSIRRQQWIAAVKRQNLDGTPWIPTKNSLICSEHFVGGKKAEHPNHPAYNPTIFQREVKVANDSRFQRSRRRHGLQNIQWQINANNSSDVNVNMNLSDNDEVCSKKENSCQTEDISDQLYTNEITEKTFICCIYIKENSSNIECAVQTSIIRKERTALTNDKKVGPDFNDKKLVFGDRCLLDCNCFHGFDSLKENEHFVDLAGVSRDVFNLMLEMLESRKELKLSNANRLLIFLMKIKMDLTFSALGVIFSVHRSSISRIFFDVLVNLANATKNYIYWPSKDAIVKTMPKCFKINYPQCRVIIDCTEFKLQQPAKISDRISLYSHYKGTYTAKALIGISPSGIITFLSPIYGGKASDIQITTESGILDKLEDNDTVLADKGFPGIKIKDGVLIVLPPFLHDGTLTENEVSECFNVASVRIHVERAIGRIKNFHILQNKLPVSLFPYMDDIVHIICVLINFMNPLIQESN